MKTEALALTGVLLLTAIAVIAGQGSQAANVTPVIFAAGNGRLEAVKLLIARGADVNAQDTFSASREERQ